MHARADQGVGLLAIVLVVVCACNDRIAPKKRAQPFDGIASALERGEAPKTSSVLVMRAGRLEHEAYFGGADAGTLHDTRSVGKSLTALAIGIAIERSRLPDTQAKAFSYLSDLRPFTNESPLKDAITIEDLLTMSSALDCDDFDDDSIGNEMHMYPKPEWGRWAMGLPARVDYQRDSSGRGPWRYCTAGTFLLGQIIERAAKQPLDRFMAEHLFAPLGIERWEFTRSPTGELLSGGMLRLRSRDLATIAWMMHAGGKHAGRQVVPAGFIDAMLTMHREVPPDGRQTYGYLMWHRTYHTRCGDFGGWYMSGNGGNVVAIVAKLDAVIVVTRTHYNRGPRMHEQTASLIEQHILPELACPAT